MALLEVRGLEKWYGRRQVVKGVDYDVEPGEIVGLLGPNGAGKTTSFRMTIGLIDADAGKVRFNGQDISRLPMFRRARLGLGYLPQEASVFKQLTVENNLMAILETVPGLTRTDRKKRQDRLLEQFGLTHVRKTMANRVSGGERRRVEIARSLVTEPKLIMLDEPFAAIDPKTVSEIQDVIRDLAKSYGIGILLTDHSVERVLESADRSYLIHDGRVVVSGSSQQILDNADARKHYLGERFDFGHRLENRHVHALDEPRPEPQVIAGPLSIPPPAPAPARFEPPEEPRPPNVRDGLSTPKPVAPSPPPPAPPSRPTFNPWEGISVQGPIDPPDAYPPPRRAAADAESRDDLYPLGVDIPDDLVVPRAPVDRRADEDFDLNAILGGSVTMSGDTMIEHLDIAETDLRRQADDGRPGKNPPRA